jgi:hypothetical protein
MHVFGPCPRSAPSARLLTQESLAQGLFRKSRITSPDKARLYRFVLEHRQLVVRQRAGVAAGMQPFTGSRCPSGDDFARQPARPVNPVSARGIHEQGRAGDGHRHVRGGGGPMQIRDGGSPWRVTARHRRYGIGTTKVVIE